MPENRGLAKEALGSFEALVMGVAGTAPAFSVAVTGAAIVAAVGVLSVGSIFYCGLIMFGVMLGFVHLSNASPNAGASYAWVGEVFGDEWGFFAGWGLLVASVFFMVSATIPAATSTLVLVAPRLVDSTSWVALTAGLWLVLVSLVVCKGIKQASYMQIVLTVLETAVIAALIVGAFVRYGHAPAHRPALSWISPFSFTPKLFATGALTAIFFYWGWDVTMNLSEESRGGTSPAAGKGAFWAMVNLILLFVILMTVVLIAMTDDQIAKANTNLLYAIANELFPKPWNYLAVFSTILSTVGTIETQILQFSRGMFAMARDGMLHPRYSKVHPEWKTPWASTVLICGLGLVLLFSSTYLPSVKAILESSIDAIGLQICFYMSLTGFACAWRFRGRLASGPLNAVSYVLWPLGSSLFMVLLAIYSVPTFDRLTDALGVGGLLLGFVPLYFARARRRGYASLGDLAGA